LQYPQEPPPIYVDPPGDNIGNAPRNYPFVVVGNPPTQAGAAPAGGLLGLLQAVMQQRNAGPYADPKISPNGAPATRPDGSSPAPFFRSPALPPQDLYEADEARQAREAAAAQLGRGVRRLARRNTT
jgi:hypothetical protein